MNIRPLASDEALRRLPELLVLLRDAVDSGASLGFLPPLTDTQGASFWQQMIREVSADTRALLVAEVDGVIAGSIQIHPAPQPNASHRAELQKLFVLRSHRRQGIGRALMTAAEAEARRRGRTLLVLDTLAGDKGEALYRSLDYGKAGEIPGYAKQADGTLAATAIYYRQLD